MIYEIPVFCVAPAVTARYQVNLADGHIKDAILPDQNEGIEAFRTERLAKFGATTSEPLCGIIVGGVLPFHFATVLHRGKALPLKPPKRPGVVSDRLYRCSNLGGQAHRLPQLCRLGQLLSLFYGLVDRPDHVESLFRQVIVIAINQALESFDCIFDGDEFARRAGEHFRHMEGL